MHRTKEESNPLHRVERTRTILHLLATKTILKEASWRRVNAELFLRDTPFVRSIRTVFFFSSSGNDAWSISSERFDVWNVTKKKKNGSRSTTEKKKMRSFQSLQFQTSCIRYKCKNDWLQGSCGCKQEIFLFETTSSYETRAKREKKREERGSLAEENISFSSSFDSF